MKKAEQKLDNKGFSLILVIICMTLIGVLTTMIVTTSVNNVQIRVVEQEASDNFYSAEEVLDEIKANVEKRANQTLGTAYTQFLQKYAATLPKDRENMFVTALAAALQDLFKNDFIDGYNEADFLSNYLGVAGGRDGVSIGRADNVLIDDDDESGTSVITIKGLEITYTDENGYKTDIKTDLVVKVTYPKFFEDSMTIGPSFLDYAIITDGDVEKNAGNSLTNINGNVYSGHDLTLNDGARMTIQSQYVIAKNIINIGNGSGLSIAKGSLANAEYASTKQAGLWTQNIQTTTTNRTSSSNNSLIISNMDCYVQDDLTINGMDDSVYISGGNYYGYGSGLSDNALSNSAININARDITLRIDGLNNLWLAGQSYISVPTGYGRDVLEDVQGTIMQGESVSFKGNQAAYLLPGDCIEGVWHNPMTRAEYDAALNAKGSLVLSTRRADSINGDIMNLDQYLDMSSSAENGDYTSRYKTVFVKYQQGGEMVYVYMNFSTPNAAKTFFDEYYSINKDLVDTRMETIGTGTIAVENINKITATGNLVVHSGGTNPNTIIHSNTAATSAEVREADYTYSGYFRSLSMSLDAGTSYFGTSDSLTECIFRLDDMATLLPLSGTKVTHESTEYTLYVANNKGGGTFTVDSGKNCGLIIATGNVHVAENFTGLIIAQGKVTVGDGVTITAAPKAMNALITGSETLKSFFKYFDTHESGLESKEAVDIYFDNWQKN